MSAAQDDLLLQLISSCDALQAAAEDESATDSESALHALRVAMKGHVRILNQLLDSSSGEMSLVHTPDRSTACRAAASLELVERGAFAEAAGEQRPAQLQSQHVAFLTLSTLLRQPTGT